MRRILLGHRGREARNEQQYSHKTTSEEDFVAIDPLSSADEDEHHEPQDDTYLFVEHEENDLKPDTQDPPLSRINTDAPSTEPNPISQTLNQQIHALSSSIETFRTTFLSQLQAHRQRIQDLSQNDPASTARAASHNRSVRRLDKAGKLAVRSAEAQLEKLREDFARLRVDDEAEGDRGHQEESRYHTTAANTPDERGELLHALAHEAAERERSRRRVVVVDWLRYHGENCPRHVEFGGCERCLEWRMGLEGGV